MTRSSGEPEQAAFQEVYAKHFRFVWRTLARLGVREADLLDVTQNVFLVVHRRLPSFEARAELTTWLFSICRLVVKDYFRSAPIRREIAVDVRDLSDRAGPADGPLHRLDAKEHRRMLDAILNEMPEKLQVVFVLYELEELSGEDIARFLEVPVGTVRSRLRLARAAFQREVKRLEAGAAGTSAKIPADTSGLPRVPRMGGAR